MGPVVTTNSATLVNKGLEVIEAHLLFDIPFDRIDVVVHPQSWCTRWSSSPTARPWPQARPPTCGCRSRSGWAGPTGSRTPPRRSTGRTRRPGSSSRWTTRRSPPSPGARGGGGGRHLPGGLQRGQRGVRRGVPRRPAPRSSRSSTRSRRCWTARRTLDEEPELTVDDVLAADGGPATRQTAEQLKDATPHDRAALRARRAALRRRRRWRPSRCTRSGTWSRPRSSASRSPSTWSASAGRSGPSRRGETEYGVKSIPLGGYIQMIGMLPPARRRTRNRVRETATPACSPSWSPTPAPPRASTSRRTTRTGSSTRCPGGRRSS